MAYTLRKLADLTTEQLDEITAVFELAFLKENAFATVVGPELFPKILPILNRAQLIAGSLGGEIVIAEETATSKIIGATIWFGPGREIYDSEEQRKLALSTLMEVIPPRVQQWYAENTPQMDAFKKATFGDRARTDWYLLRVGVHPEWQGKGVGTALIEEGRKRVGKHGIALQAVEPKNVSYYEYLGFKNKGQTDVKAPYGEFTVTALLWEPSVSS